MPSLVKYENGIRVIDTERKTSLIADPTTIATAKKNTAAIITHAHTDHAIAFPNEGIKVYATATNLFTITKYSGYDPEADSFSYDASRIGIDFNSYPSVRALLFGLNLTF